MNLLITGAFQYTDEQLFFIKKLGYNVFFLKNENEELNFNIEQIEGVICNSLFLYHDIEKFSKLKFIQLTSAGLDRIPIDIIKKRNILVYNARGVYSVPMAEWTIFRILEYYKESNFFYSAQKTKIWNKNRNLKELYNKKIAILGYGNVGKEIAKRLKSFGCTLSCFDIELFVDSNIDYSFYINDFDSKISTFDIIIVTLPLTDSTYHYINNERIKKMNDNCVLINISRGKVIDEKILIENMKNGKPKFVIMDVFENEPLSKESELWNFNNIAISPHNSFIGEGNNERLFELVYNNLKKMI